MFASSNGEGSTSSIGGVRAIRPSEAKSHLGIIDGKKYQHHRKPVCILSDPPFVAVPFAKNAGAMTQALYSVGSGEDGMDILRTSKHIFSQIQQ